VLAIDDTAVGDNTRVNLTNLTITGGKTLVVGGGVWLADSGTLSLNNTAVSNNLSGNSGGGIFAVGVVTLGNKSSVSANTAGHNGGICTNGLLTLSNATVSNNSARAIGGGIYSGVGASVFVSGGQHLLQLVGHKWRRHLHRQQRVADAEQRHRQQEHRV
jgi:predicted outer membrane repeat protein